MKIEIEISDKHIRQLISGAGSRYWADDFEWATSSHGRPWALAFTIVEYEDGPPKTHTVTPAMLAEGLSKMSKVPRNKGGWHFENCMEGGSDDAWTGDALIQFAIFGELKYG